MTGQRRTADYLLHVIGAVDRIKAYCERESLQGFLGNEMLQDAVIRNLEVIGEACSHLRRTDPAFVSAHPEIPWTSAIGNRNALAHGYFSVDLELVWATVTGDLDDLRAKVSAALATLSA